MGLFNVWLLRFKQKTPYRGQHASTMLEEFAVYGLPKTFVYIVGTLKIAIAVTLIVGIWHPSLVLPAASLLAVLMLGAVAMHLKVADPMKKSAPALAMLAMSLVLIASALLAEHLAKS